jgi:hypothetical protein
MHGCHKYAHLGCRFVGVWEAKIQRSAMEGEAVRCHNFSGCDQYRVFLTTLSMHNWGSPRGLKRLLYADEVCEVQIFISSRGPLRVDISALRSQTGKCCRGDSDSPTQVTGMGGGGAYQKRPCRLAAGQAGIGAQRGRPRLVWGGRRASKLPHCWRGTGPRRSRWAAPSQSTPGPQSHAMCIGG